MIEVVPFPRALADARENRKPGVHLGDVVDELLDQNRFPDSCSSEQSDFAAFRIRSQKVDDLDSGHENLGFGRLRRIFRRGLVDGPRLVRFDRALFVYGFADDVDDPSERRVADRNGDRASGILDGLPPDETFAGVHRDRPDGVFAQVLRHFKHQPLPLVFGFQGIQDFRQFAVELNVDDRADNLGNLASRLRFSHLASPIRQSASAPEMISISSLVIAACRERL